MASFVEWAGDTANNLEAWTGFTDDWLDRRGTTEYCASDVSTLVRISRVFPGQLADFDAAALQAYPGLSDGIPITRLCDTTGELSTIDENVTTSSEMWPVLYSNPTNDTIVPLGFDISSHPLLARAIELMLVSNDTVLTDTMTLSAPDPVESGFVVLHPVFANGNKRGGIVGCIATEMRVRDMVVDALDKTSFDLKYPGGAFAVFLHVDDSDDEEGDAEYTLLFDLQSDDVNDTPVEVASRGSESFTYVASLTSSKTVVIVSSFEPCANDRTSLLVVFAGCAVSVLTTAFLYCRQNLLLTYKDAMERAKMHSSFKSRFVADVSHEIRTPLNGIIGTAELLAEQKLSDDSMELVSTMQACGRILTGM